MEKEQLKIKADIMDIQLDALVRDAHELREEVAELKHKIAYLTMLEDLDKEYGDMFETHIGDK